MMAKILVLILPDEASEGLIEAALDDAPVHLWCHTDYIFMGNIGWSTAHTALYFKELLEDLGRMLKVWRDRTCTIQEA